MPPANPPTLAQRAVRSDEALAQELSGESVILDLASEQYFGLDAIGIRIWALLGDDDRLQAVHDAFCVEYVADPGTIRDDLLTLVGELASAGLVTLAD